MTAMVADRLTFDTWDEAVKWVDKCKCDDSNSPYVSDVVQSYYCKCRNRRVLWCKSPDCGCTDNTIIGKEGQHNEKNNIDSYL